MPANFKLLRELSRPALAGRRVVLRVDLNVPIVAGQVKEIFRLERIQPTIDFLLKHGAKVIMLSHLGDSAKSLKPVADYFSSRYQARFVPSVDSLPVFEPGVGSDVFLFENLRQQAGEEKNDPAFAARLANLGDLYVNDAFASSHREHASIVGLPKLLPSLAGLLFEDEIKNLSKAFSPERPFVVILGGVKFGTKLPLIERLLELADQVFVYGALAHAFFKELGYETGQSLVDHETHAARDLLQNEKIVLPVDVKVRNGPNVSIKRPDQLAREENIIDVGLDSVEQIREAASTAKFILWNGPLGNFEYGFSGATHAVAKILAESAAYTIVGGGDTVAAIHELNLFDQLDFVSTGGGAMLDFLATGTLPGLEALKASTRPIV